MGLDVLCTGELLVDLVSKDYASDLSAAGGFEPHFGGSPANLAANLHQLGLEVGLVATVGEDAFGGFLRKQVRSRGLSDAYLRTAKQAPTTAILVTKTTGSPDFEVYRGADVYVEYAQLAEALAQHPKLFHTTCNGLSGLPARSHILRAASAFAKTGGLLSIDANYAQKIWPQRQRAQQVVKQYISHGALVKVSEVDWQRLFERPLTPANCVELVKPWLAAGARLVCCTFGGDGAVVVTPEETIRQEPLALEVVDATGAGDSFWSGFLAAYVNGETPGRCLTVATAVAARKLRQQGPLRSPVDWRALL